MNDPILPSWREGPTRSAILRFLDRIDGVPAAQRVAVFDNDGTMMCEKPTYVQLQFMLNQLRHATTADPSIADRDEFHALTTGDRAAQAEMGLERVVGALVSLFDGLTPEEFDVRVSRFFSEERHPERGVPFRQMRYKPMLELIDELRSREFDVYVVTGGGAEFVRTISQDIYRVKPEGVVGSQIDYELDVGGEGSIRLVRTSHLVGGPNEGSAKPPNIQRILGRRPIVAGGNSAGDAEMLDYAMSSDGPSLALLVNHDDADREYAYASEAASFTSEENILEAAARRGWTVASMRDDWSTVFANE